MYTCTDWWNQVPCTFYEGINIHIFPNLYTHHFMIGNLSKMTTVASLKTFFGLDKLNLPGIEFTVVELGVTKNGQPLGIAFVTVNVCMKKHMLGFNKQVLDGRTITVKYLHAHQYLLKRQQWVMKQDGVITSRHLRPKFLIKFKLFDFGANLLPMSMLKDFENTLANGYHCGVTLMVIPGYNIKQSKKALELCKEHTGQLYFTAGIHPHFVDEYNSDSMAEIRNMVEEHCIAVGPTGLDFTNDCSLANKKKQEEVFEAQVNFACKIGNRPIYVYERGAHSEVLTILTKNKDKLAGVLIHNFSGTPEQAEAYVKIGCYIGVTGDSVLLQRNNGMKFSEFREKVPLEQILLESNGLPSHIRKQQVGLQACNDSKQNANHPVHVVRVSLALAKSFNISIAEVSTKISAASKCFIWDLSKPKLHTSITKAKQGKGTYFKMYAFGFCLLFLFICGHWFSTMGLSLFLLGREQP
ncbi:hypothetical protein ACJMK2_008327 [Sinanodonta woodiana]|uniref:Deoxyribonuclease TATDN1 n=1 Tax=Sinanodonta woodiana TaxID=1069815 RepID=A0ABD3VL89_SINWO